LPSTPVGANHGDDCRARRPASRSRPRTADRIGLATAFGPLAVLPLVLGLRSVARCAARSLHLPLSWPQWHPGIGLTLSSLGFGAITTFVTLLFAINGWMPVWLGISAFAGAFW